MEITLPWLSEVFSVFNLAIPVFEGFSRILPRKTQQVEPSQTPPKKQSKPLKLAPLERLEQTCQKLLDGGVQNIPKDVYAEIEKICRLAQEVIQTSDRPEHTQRNVTNMKALLEEIKIIMKTSDQEQNFALNTKRSFSRAFTDDDDLERNLKEEENNKVNLTHILPLWYRDYIQLSFQNNLCIDLKPKSSELNSQHFQIILEAILNNFKDKTVWTMSSYWTVFFTNRWENFKHLFGFQKQSLTQQEIKGIEMNCSKYMTSEKLKFILDFIERTSNQLQIITLDLSKNSEQDDFLTAYNIRTLFNALCGIPNLSSVDLNLEGREIELRMLRNLVCQLSRSATLEKIVMHLSACEECHDLKTFIRGDHLPAFEDDFYGESNLSELNSEGEEKTDIIFHLYSD